ncbi:MAG TPA: hypothetical protein VE978_02935 [Chitinophagales bacterium]|nr:hypothetical protein [Chitinophagales bacterium]
MAENKIIIDEGTEENWETYQPEVNLIPMVEFIQIKFTKKVADAVNIYKRHPGNEPWEFIATAVNSPFDDHESEENWEYCIRGVKENREVGIPVVISVLTNNLHSK